MVLYCNDLYDILYFMFSDKYQFPILFLTLFITLSKIFLCFCNLSLIFEWQLRKLTLLLILVFDWDSNCSSDIRFTRMFYCKSSLIKTLLLKSSLMSRFFISDCQVNFVNSWLNLTADCSFAVLELIMTWDAFRLQGERAENWEMVGNCCMNNATAMVIVHAIRPDDITQWCTDFGNSSWLCK